MPSDSERKAVKTIPLMTCTNKDCSCTGMDFCNVLPECANCGACGMPLSIKKRSPKPNNRNPSHAVTTVLDDLASATARVAELEALVLELVEATEAEYHVVAGDQYHMLCPGSAIKVNTTCSWIVMATGERSSHRNKDRAQILNAARAKALALLNSGNEGNSADQ